LGEEDLPPSGLILVCGMLLFNCRRCKIRMFIRDPLLCALLGQILEEAVGSGAIFGPHLSQDLVERKTVYFVRHGESTWNDTFNKGHLRSTAAFVIGFIPGLLKATLYELYLLLSGKLDRYVTFVHFSNLEPYGILYLPLNLDPLAFLIVLTPPAFQYASLLLSKFNLFSALLY
jgi:hypothetical protein